MSGQFRVDSDRLRGVGSTTGRCAEGLRKAMQPMADEPGADGLASLHGLASLGQEWRQAGEGMAGAVEIDGDELVSASQTYQDTEDSNTGASSSGGG